MLIRLSPIAMVRNLAAAQFTVATLYVLAGTVAHYASIWRGLGIASYVPFQVAQAMFVFLGELILIGFIFLVWYRETITVENGSLLWHRGVLSRRHQTIALDRIASVSYRQGVVGRMAGFGTVEIVDRTGAVMLSIDHVADPAQFAHSITHGSVGLAGADPQVLVASPEHERLERKSTFRWDLRAEKVNKTLERSALKTVAAFLNTNGGHLLLGVADDGTAVGMQHDYASLPRADRDGFENHFSNLLSASLGPLARRNITLKPFTHEGKECVLVSVMPSSTPVYASLDDQEEFFIRTGNGTSSLKVSDAHRYIASRFS
jgi:membrane protein YdbS with pleckstrin-like domain